jgi:hypothetical protein
MLGDVAGEAGSVTIVGTLRPWGSTLSVNGDWSMTGAFTAGTSTIDFTGTATQSINHATIFNNVTVTKASGTVTAIAAVTIGGTLVTSGGGTFSAGASSIEVTGLSTIGTGTTVTSTAGTLTFTGAVTGNGTAAIGSSAGNILFTSTLTLNNTSSLSVGSGTATTTGALSGAGNVYSNAGTLVIGASFTGVGFYAGSGTVIFDGGTIVHNFTYNNLVIRTAGAVTVDGNIVVGGTLATSGTAALNLEANTLTVTGASTIGTGSTVTSTTGTLTFTGLVTNSGNLGSSTGNMEIGPIILNGGSIFDVGAGTATTSGITLSGTINGGSGTLALTNFLNSAGGTFNANTGKLRIAGAGNYNVVGFAFNNVEMQKTAGTATFITTSPTVAGTLVTSGAGTLSTVALNLTVTGISTIGTGTTVTSTSGTLTFTGAVTNAGSIGSSSGDQLFGSTLANSGVLDIGSGVATSTGSLDNSGGTINGNSGRLELVADFVSPAPGTFNAGTGTVRIYGPATQSIRGLAFNDLQVIKSGASVATITDVASTVAGTLTTSGSGTLSAAGLGLTVTGASTIGTGTIVTSTSGTLTFTGLVTNNGNLGSSTGNMAIGPIILNGGSVFDVGAGTATTSGITLSGTINGGSGTLALTDFLNSAGGTFNANTGKLRIAGAGNYNVVGFAFNNVEMQKTAGTATFITTSPTVAGTLVTSGAGTLSTVALNLTVTGISTIGSGTTVTSTSGVLTFTGAVTNAGSIGSSSGNQLFSSTLANTGTLAIGSGVATTTGAVTGAGVIQGNAGTLVVLNDLTFTTFTGGTGTLRVYGAGSTNQSIKGGAFYNLEIKKTGGTATIVTANATVGGTLVTIGTGTLDAQARNLTVTGISTIGAGTTVTSTSGTLSFIAAATNNGSIGSNIGNESFGSTLDNNGTLDVGQGTTLVTGTLTNGGTGTINGGNSSGGGALEVRADYANTGTFNAQQGTFKISGTATQSIKGEAFKNLEMTKASGVATMTAISTVAGTLTTSGAGTLSTAALALSVTGISTIGSGTTVTSTSGTLTFTGAVTSAGSIGSVSGNKLFSSTLANTGTLVIGSGVATTTGAVTGAGVIQGNAGTLVVLSDLTFTTFTANTGKLRVYGSSATDQSIKGATFYDVEIKKTGGTATITTANATVGGTLVTIGTGTLSSAALNLTVTGATTIGTTGTVTSTAGTLAFAAVTNAGSLGSNSGPITMTTLGNTGTLSIGGMSTTTGAVTSSGTIKLNGETLNVGGNWTDTGTLTPVAGTVRFNGGGAQSIATEASFYNLTIDKAAGTATLTGHVTTTNLAVDAGTLAVADKILYAPGTYTNLGLVTETTGSIKHTGVYNWVNGSGTTQTEYTVPTSSYLRVTDANRNLNGSLAETITVPVTLDATSGSDTETITLTETGLATGIFMSAAIPSYSTTIVHPNNGEIEVLRTGNGTETYTDNQDAFDTGATLVSVAFTSGGSGGTGGGGGGGGMAPVVTTQQTSYNDPNRIANLANLAAMNLPIHSLVKLPDDGKLSTQEDSAVYYVGADGKRHAFPNSKVYFTWYSNFDGVVVITPSQLASIPLGTNVRYKPGSRMVKFTTDPKVYAVDVNSTLRWVKTEALAIALYGENWNTKIDDISDAFFSNYGFGADISVPSDFNVSQILGLEQFISENFNHS